MSEGRYFAVGDDQLSKVELALSYETLRWYGHSSISFRTNLSIIYRYRHVLRGIGKRSPSSCRWRETPVGLIVIVPPDDCCTFLHKTIFHNAFLSQTGHDGPRWCSEVLGNRGPGWMCHERMISVRACHSLSGPDLLGDPQLSAPRVMNCQLSLARHPPSLIKMWLSMRPHVDVDTVFTTIVECYSKADFQRQSWRQRLSCRLKAALGGL